MSDLKIRTFRTVSRTVSASNRTADSLTLGDLRDLVEATDGMPANALVLTGSKPAEHWAYRGEYLIPDLLVRYDDEVDLDKEPRQ